MDYEKKYNEALERASHIKDNNTVATPQEVAEHIFPELRESEDERIRKELIIHLEQEERSATLEVNKKRWREMISYLEKQKEQNRDGKKWIYEDDYHKDMERTFNDGKDEVLENPEKYGLQKEQKPAKWSEEDEKIVYEISVYLEELYSRNRFSLDELNEKHRWLKSLRPQPKQEWTEEDKENIESIKIILYKALPKGISCKEEVLDLTDWLNNLRPSWKPSEEQMKVLDEAFMKSDNEKYRQAISSLYYDLQKL